MPSISKRSLSRLSLPSLFGRDVWQRARSASFGLLGLAAAMGLAAVAFALQLSWPTSPRQPLPSIPPPKQGLGAAVAIAPRHLPVTPPPVSPRHAASAPRPTPRGGSPTRQVAVPVATDRGAAEPVSAPQPPPQPAQARPGKRPSAAADNGGAPRPPEAPPQAPPSGAPAKPVAAVPPPPPSSAPPPAEPEPVAESSDVPGNGNAYGKGNGKGPPSPPPAVGNPHTGEAPSP